MAEPLWLREERAGGCAPAESHNQIIAPDSSFVYQAVTKGQLLSKNSHEAAQSSDNLRCLIPVHSKPVGPPLKLNIYTEAEQHMEHFASFYQIQEMFDYNVSDKNNHKGHKVTLQ